MRRFALTVALPKGRMFREAYEVLKRAGLDLPEVEGERTLLHGKEGGVALLELRNKDVPIYVDLGIAEIGVVGKDVLLDSGRDLFEPVDLGFGACRLSLIRRPGDTGPIRRVATKYPNFTARLLKERGWAADVVELSGNIELAAVTGLADACLEMGTPVTGGNVSFSYTPNITLLPQQGERLARELMSPIPVDRKSTRLNSSHRL